MHELPYTRTDIVRLSVFVIIFLLGVTSIVLEQRGVMMTAVTIGVVFLPAIGGIGLILQLYFLVKRVKTATVANGQSLSKAALAEKSIRDGRAIRKIIGLVILIPIALYVLLMIVGFLIWL